MPHASLGAVALVVVLASPPAAAAPCTGFTDVEVASPLCVNIASMKNRGITLECAATLYCPNNFITRLPMSGVHVPARFPERVLPREWREISTLGGFQWIP